MAELKLVEPLLSNMEVVSCVSKRGGTSVYIVQSLKTNLTYILKHISVPESQTQVQALLYTGAADSEQAAQEYYKQVVSDYQAELELLETLAASQNLDCFRSYQIEPKENEIGFDVYLLAEHRKTLAEVLSDQPMTQQSALSLGIDLCNAMADLRSAGLMHRDVKPENIYLSSQGHYLLGDLGIAKISDLKYCAMPEHMMSSYSAPELFSLLGTLDQTDDIYAAGLVLYRIFNGNHGPFEDEKTSPKAADKRRVTGEALPAPMYADYELAEILLKACSFATQERYQTPEEFRDALIDYRKRNQLSDDPIVPPIVSDGETVDLAEEEVEPVQFADVEDLPEDFKEHFSPDTEMLNSIIESVHQEAEQPEMPEWAEKGHEEQETASTEEAAAAAEAKNPAQTDEDASLQPIPSSADSLEPEEKLDAIPVENTAKPRKRKKKNRWLPITLISAGIALLAAVLAYFLIYVPNTISIHAITLVDRSADSVTVNIDTKAESGAFDVTCTDTYGNSKSEAFVAGSDTTFTGLEAGTQYTVSVEPADGKRVRGEETLLVSTYDLTEILSFTATANSVTEAELNLMILDGQDPGVWTVRYEADGVDAQEITFSGHSTVVSGLEPNKDYTFTLLAPEGSALSGATTAEFSTTPTVEIESIKAAISSTSAIVSWTISGTEPENWTVKITGPDGYNDTQIVSEPTITFDDLTSGETYEITISAPTMLDNIVTTVKPSVTNITSLTATLDEEAEAVKLVWVSESDPADTKWHIAWNAKNCEADSNAFVEAEADTDTVSIPLSQLLPDTTYTFTLSLSSGDMIDGKKTVSFRTPEADKFSGYGLTNTYLGLFLEPSNENWTVNNLSTARSSFDTDETIAYALQALSNLQSSAEEVTCVAAIRDADGKLLSTASQSGTWDDLWQNSLLVGTALATPQTAGSYQLEIYLNGQLAGSQTFTVN